MHAHTHIYIHITVLSLNGFTDNINIRMVHIQALLLSGMRTNTSCCTHIHTLTCSRACETNSHMKLNVTFVFLIILIMLMLACTLTGCLLVNDTSLQQFASYCSQLRKLDISYSKRITDDGLVTVSKVCMHCAFLCAYVCACVCMCVRAYVCACVCMCVSMCVRVRAVLYLFAHSLRVLVTFLF